MKVKTLLLKNFRNFKEETIDFADGINILTGKNAQGKTNTAEAIFFLCTGYSPRANKDKFVIRTGEESATIECNAETKYGNVNLKIEFFKNEKKSIFVNGVKVLKVGEILGNLNSVFFNPAELKLVQESPEDRRRFMNLSLSQMNKPYFYSLQRYNKILAQRNNLLKEPDVEVIKETLPVWDMQLTKEASKIIVKRNEFLSLLSPIAEEKQALLSGGIESLKMKTESGYEGSEEEVANKLYNDLKENLEKDIRLGYTSIGPHRDDIKFTLNDMDVKTFCSQGQQRTVALSLKLAEAEIFYNRFNEYPVLILDDVLSELDKSRQKRLVSAVSKMQTVFTSTYFSHSLFLGETVNKIEIENGTVKRQ